MRRKRRRQVLAQMVRRLESSETTTGGYARSLLIALDATSYENAVEIARGRGIL